MGYLFWRQIFGDDPNRDRLHPALQFFYLFMAIPIDTFTGLSLAGAPSRCSRPTARRSAAGLCRIAVLTPGDRPMSGPPYRRGPHVGGGRHADAVADDPRRPAWMHMDERKAVRIDRELDAQLSGRGVSAAQVHQLDPDAVGVGAVDELEGRAAEVDGRWG